LEHTTTIGSSQEAVLHIPAPFPTGDQQRAATHTNKNGNVDQKYTLETIVIESLGQGRGISEMVRQI